MLTGPTADLKERHGGALLLSMLDRINALPPSSRHSRAAQRPCALTRRRGPDATVAITRIIAYGNSGARESRAIFNASAPPLPRCLAFEAMERNLRTCRKSDASAHPHGCRY